MWEVHTKDAFKYKEKIFKCFMYQCSHVFMDRGVVIWENFVMQVGEACKHRCNQHKMPTQNNNQMLDH